jgi:hypothetical protein
MGAVKQDMLLGRAGGGRAGAAAKDEDSLGLRPSTVRESLVEFAGILSPYFWPKSRTNKVLALAWYVQARSGDGCPAGGARAPGPNCGYRKPCMAAESWPLPRSTQRCAWRIR